MCEECWSNHPSPEVTLLLRCSVSSAISRLIIKSDHIFSRIPQLGQTVGLIGASDLYVVMDINHEKRVAQLMERSGKHRLIEAPFGSIRTFNRKLAQFIHRFLDSKEDSRKQERWWLRLGLPESTCECFLTAGFERYKLWSWAASSARSLTVPSRRKPSTRMITVTLSRTWSPRRRCTSWLCRDCIFLPLRTRRRNTENCWATCTGQQQRLLEPRGWPMGTARWSIPVWMADRPLITFTSTCSAGVRWVGLRDSTPYRSGKGSKSRTGANRHPFNVHRTKFTFKTPAEECCLLLLPAHTCAAGSADFARTRTVA